MKFIFLGAQGSGKSTQAKLLSEEFKLPYLEMGQLLRNRAKIADNLGEQIKSVLATGQLVPSEITISILRENLEALDSVKGYVLDGFPRNFVQYNALDHDIDLVFYIKVSDEEGTRRLMKRARADDTALAMKKRFQIYHQETEPLLAKFREREILKEIDGERSPEEIHKEVFNIARTHGKYQ